MKKKIIFLALCAALLLAGCEGKPEAVKQLGTVEADFQFADGGVYQIGDVMPLPIPKLNAAAKVKAYTVEVALDGQTVATLTENDTAYRFASGGAYTFTYRMETETEIQTDSFTCTAEKGSGVILDWLPEQVGRFDTVTTQPVTMQLGDEQVTAKLTVTDPTGETVLPQEDKISFEKEGEYTFRFAFQGANGETAEEIRTVFASLNTSDLFSFVSGGVSRENAASAPEGMGGYNNDHQNPDNIQVEQSGVKLTFNGVGTVRFNNVIDLSKLSPDTRLIELFALPATVPDYTGHVQGTELSAGDTLYPSGGYTHGTANFTQFEIKLIDKYDPYNVVTIRYFAQKKLSFWNWNEGYVSVGNTTLMQALNEDGVLQQASAAYNDAGYLANFSFYGEGNTPFNLRLDYENKCFYTYNNGKDRLILDYDDAETLGAANVWNGFTTGECYLELSFPSVTADSSVLITKVLGTDLSGGAPADTTPPQLTLETQADELPVAQKGLFYSIPNVTAFDAITGQCQVSVKVTDNAGAEVKLADGGFTPDAVGQYTVTYTAKDFYGNEAKKTYVVSALEQVEEITVSMADNTPFYAGVSAMEPVFQFDGGSGEKHYTVRYLLEGKEVTPESGWLTFHQTGTLQMEFTITDHLGTCEKSLTQQVLAPDGPVLEDVILPQAIFAGRAYRFPIADAFDYKTQTYAPVRVSVNGVTLDGSRSYTPTEADREKGSVIVVYTAAGSGTVTSQSYTVKVMEHSAAASAVVEGNGVTMELGDRYAAITANSNFRFHFAYAVAAQKFALSLGGVPSEENFNTISLQLQDARDTNKTVTVKLTKQSDGKFAVSLCDRTELVTVPWVGTENDNQATLVITLQNDRLVLKNGSELLFGTYPITAWDNGLAFDGFTSGGLYAAAEVGGVMGKTGLRLYGFSGQSYNRFNIFADAQIAFSEPFESAVVEKGTTVQIPIATGYSPVSYQVSARYEVIAPDGAVIASGDSLDGGSFVCDGYGQYKVAWYLQDEVNNKSAVAEYTFTVYDRTAPVITVDSAPLKGSVNKEITLPNGKVTDNVDGSQCIFKVFVINAHNCSVEVTASMKYTPTEAGNYRIVYMAMDAAGNISVETVALSVEGGK